MSGESGSENQRGDRAVRCCGRDRHRHCSGPRRPHRSTGADPFHRPSPNWAPIRLPPGDRIIATPGEMARGYTRNYSQPGHVIRKCCAPPWRKHAMRPRCDSVSYSTTPSAPSVSGMPTAAWSTSIRPWPRCSVSLVSICSSTRWPNRFIPMIERNCGDGYGAIFTPPAPAGHGRNCVIRNRARPWLGHLGDHPDSAAGRACGLSAGGWGGHDRAPGNAGGIASPGPARSVDGAAE